MFLTKICTMTKTKYNVKLILKPNYLMTKKLHYHN